MSFREANCQQLLTAWRKNGRCAVKSGGQWLNERLGEPGSNLPGRPGKAKPLPGRPGKAKPLPGRPGKAKPPPGNVSERRLLLRTGFAFLQGLFQLPNQLATKIAEPRFIIGNPR